MIDGAVRPDVLGRLFVIPSMLDVLPGLDAIARFLQSALSETPGVENLWICKGGTIYPQPHPATLHPSAAHANTLAASDKCVSCITWDSDHPDPIAHPQPLCPLVAEATNNQSRCAILLATPGITTAI